MVEEILGDRFKQYFYWGLFIIILFYIIKIFLPILRFLFLPIILPPVFIINIIKDFNNLSFIKLFTLGYFNAQDFTFSNHIYFIILSVILFPLLISMTFSKNRKIYKCTLYFLFIFFSFYLLNLAVYHYMDYTKPGKILIGTGNINPILNWIMAIAILLYILYLINKTKFNIKYFLKISLKYIITVLQVILSLFLVSLIKPLIFDKGTDIFDKIASPLFFLLVGGFFFLLLELCKDFFDKIIN